MNEMEQTLDVFMKRLTDAQENVERYVSAALLAYPDDVRDVVQETNYALIAHARDYRPDAPFLPWAITFAKNQVRAFRQRRDRNRLVFDDALLDHYTHSAFTDGSSLPEDGSVRLKHLHACLDKLPERDRSLIRRHYLDNHPLVRIAREERKPESTIRMAVYRARQALADCIKRLCRLGGETREESARPFSTFNDLLAQVIDEERIDDSRFVALAQALRETPEHMGEFIDQTDIDFLLSKQAAMGNANLFRGPLPAVAGWARWRRMAAWAASLVILAGALAYGAAALGSAARRAASAPPVLPAVLPAKVSRSTVPAVSVVPAIRAEAAPILVTKTTVTAAPPAAATLTKEEETMKTPNAIKAAVVAAAAATVTTATLAEGTKEIVTLPVRTCASMAVSATVDWWAGERSIATQEGLDLESRTGTTAFKWGLDLNSTAIHGGAVIIR